MMSPIITDAIKAMLPTATAPVAPETYDPVLILEHEHRAARKAWGRAQEAAEEIECGLPDNIREPGVLIFYVTKKDKPGDASVFSRDEAKQAKAAATPVAQADAIEDGRLAASKGVTSGCADGDSLGGS